MTDVVAGADPSPSPRPPPSGKRKRGHVADAAPPKPARKRIEKKAKLPRGAARAPEQWCRACVARLFRDLDHSCDHQQGTGARCVDCADQNHSCVPIPRAAAIATRAAVDAARDPEVSQEEATSLINLAQRQLRAKPLAAPTQRSAPAPTAGETPDWVYDLLAVGERIAVALEGLQRLYAAKSAAEEPDDFEE